MYQDLIFTGEDLKDNWFYNKYFYSGSNGRYFTFQLVMNLLRQNYSNPLIIETGCQRLENDIGAGMSTSIFAEYISKYGGKLITVDNDPKNISLAKSVVSKDWPHLCADFIVSDSVEFLSNCSIECDLLYLDSFDYPYIEILNQYYGGRYDWNAAMEIVKNMDRDFFIKKHFDEINECQVHALNEFQAYEKKFKNNSLLLVDDNFMAGGGKPRLLKDYLVNTQQWICLLDFQQSLWIKR